jgi:peroxiredoxin
MAPTVTRRNGKHTTTKDGRAKWMKPGAKLPDFELPDENGVMHRLSDLQGDDPMVLMLGRGEHCPRERQHQRSMVEFHGWCMWRSRTS